MAAGRLSAAADIERAIAAADAPACRHAFVRRFDAMARAAAVAVDAARAAGAPVPPLAGLAVSVKDLFDVAGVPSTAASKSMADAAPATADSPAVARLRAAGAALIGHTNLTEFAFSGVGINPHHGTPANAGTLALDATPRIPGGSTSGGAVTVAAGAAWAALGSDTRGSIRVPAALHGLVGFKNTQALTPNDGCLPLSFTLDTACAITRSVRDAVLLHEVLAARRVTLRGRPLRALRLALPLGGMLDGLDATVARAFERCLARLRAAGAEIVERGAAGRRRAGRQQRPDRRGRGLGLAPRPHRCAPGRLRPARAGAHPQRQRHRARPTTSTACRRGAAGSPRWKPRRVASTPSSARRCRSSRRRCSR